MDIAEACALVDERMAVARGEYNVPTIAYGLTLGGALVHSGAVAAEGHAAPTASSAFRIASMTKSVTAATVLALRDAGFLALDDPVSRWLPWADGHLGPPSGARRGAQEVTLRHLLTMTAGFPTDDPWGDRQESLPLADFDALVSEGLSACRPPGLEFEYSNLGYALLGRVIAQATGEDYRTVVRTTLLEPLGMTATTYDVDAVTVEGAATSRQTGYHPLADGLVPEPDTSAGAFSPMGGLWSTVEDLATWIGFLEAAWADDPREEPLSRWSRREMQRPHVLARIDPPSESSPAVAQSYGMGLYVADDVRLGRFVHHSGGYPGFGSHMRWHPDTRWGIVALANRTYAPMGKACPPILEEIVAGDAEQARRTRAFDRLWPRTREAMDVAESLLAEWRDDVVDAWGAMNLDLDQPRAQRRAAWARAGERGPFTRDAASIEALSPAHVRWRMSGEGGDVTLEILLTPEPVPRLQTLSASVQDTTPSQSEAE